MYESERDILLKPNHTLQVQEKQGCQILRFNTKLPILDTPPLDVVAA